MGWNNEKIYNSALEFFAAVRLAIQNAQVSIEIEMYIFNLDDVGQELFKILREAAERSVLVRILVDGVGAPHWLGHPLLQSLPENLQLRVFHPAPWPYSRFLMTDLKRPWRWWRFLQNLNSRNHKKVILVDGHTAFATSANIWNQSLSWREIGVQIQGQEVELLKNSFDINWRRGHYSGKIWPRFQLHPDNFRMFKTTNFLLNYPLWIRLWRNRLWLSRIQQANTRIWLETPYFLPGAGLIGRLCRAALNGVDVRLIIPAHSDVKIVNWLMPLMLGRLLKCRVKIFSYTPKILHAKYSLIDNWILVGSSNLNHRSRFLDMELDIVLGQDESRTKMTELFLQDQNLSVAMSSADLAQRPLWQKFLGQLIFLIRAWL